MKYLISILFCALLMGAFAQSKPKSLKRKGALPAYFGVEVRPVFPSKFLGETYLELESQGFVTTLTQKPGYGFGGIVRAGITKLIAFESGINFTRRNFDLTMELADSNSYAEDQLGFIEYAVPINGLFYIQLSKELFMNASIGVAITYQPTDIGVVNQPGGLHTYRHTGLTREKVGASLNADLGFEYRTKKQGFFYLGGSARVPFAPLFDLVADWEYQGNFIRVDGPVDGSFLSIDLKYFFPIVRNKGPQPELGPLQ
ncbi:MAG: hypothetical protein P8H56_07840 [Crocinitomicaceae bacterium]|nr:hypothetical protein [Crocinitomicaceae bacterium]MDG1658476.1 hypothetical protein [Crocinitomicaceae bacterium]